MIRVTLNRPGELACRTVGPLLVTAGLIAAAFCSGCVHTPRQGAAPAPAAQAAAPAAPPRDDTPTVTVDLNRAVGENTTFHQTATTRQKFQVRLDFGRVFETQGSLDRALQEYQDALKVAEARGREHLGSSEQVLAHRRIASVLDRMGRFTESESHYKSAQRLGPRDAKVWNDTGYSYYLQGRWRESERALRTAMKLAPDDARIRTNLGMTLGAAGKTQEAVPLLGGNQGDAIGHANLGYLLASTGQYERARQEYHAALSMRPDLDLARRALVQLDRQERGIVPAPRTMMADNPQSGTRSIDPQVTPTSVSNVAPPNTGATMSSLPLPQLPSRTLPGP